MTDAISKKSEGSPVELGKEELGAVAGGAYVLTTFYQAVCSTCGWEATFGTRDKANAAVTDHIQNNPGHKAGVSATHSL